MSFEHICLFSLNNLFSKNNEYDSDLFLVKVRIANAPLLAICKFCCLYVMMIHLNLLVTIAGTWSQGQLYGKSVIKNISQQGGYHFSKLVQ